MRFDVRHSTLQVEVPCEVAGKPHPVKVVIATDSKRSWVKAVSASCDGRDDVVEMKRAAGSCCCLEAATAILTWAQTGVTPDTTHRMDSAAWHIVNVARQLGPVDTGKVVTKRRIVRSADKSKELVIFDRHVGLTGLLYKAGLPFDVMVESTTGSRHMLISSAMVRSSKEGLVLAHSSMQKRWEGYEPFRYWTTYPASAEGLSRGLMRRRESTCYDGWSFPASPGTLAGFLDARSLYETTPLVGWTEMSEAKLVDTSTRRGGTAHCYTCDQDVSWGQVERHASSAGHTKWEKIAVSKAVSILETAMRRK